MKVDRVDVLRTPKGAFTVLFLPENPLNTHWDKIVSEGVAYKTVYMSGGHLDQWAIEGEHDLTGKEIQFV